MQATYVLLPPGERLAAQPALDPEQWVIKAVEVGNGESRAEALILRPLQDNAQGTTGMLFQSGLLFFVQLLSRPIGGWLSVSFLTDTPRDAPQPSRASQAPVIALGRIFEGYTRTLGQKTTPAWMPSRILDDGTRTFILFPEALTFTRAPQVFGVQPNRQRALVQSHMYVHPDPEKGAVLVVQGLWPQLELQDAAQLRVKITRGATS
jgi:type IV secretion system protein VirB9